MAIKSHWITHKNKRIYFMDGSGLGANFELAKNEIDATASAVSTEPEKSVLILFDVNNTVVTSQSLTYLKEALKLSSKHVKKVASIGVKGAKKIIMSMIIRVFNLNVEPFDNLEQAKDWLVEGNVTENS
ncbi:MAG: hypothetical protein ABIG64_02135 [Candidatus Omnitrophota bacterium]